MANKVMGNGLVHNPAEHAKRAEESRRRTVQAINGRLHTSDSEDTDAILARESQRLGVKLEIKKP